MKFVFSPYVIVCCLLALKHQLTKKQNLMLVFAHNTEIIDILTNICHKTVTGSLSHFLSGFDLLIFLLHIKKFYEKKNHL